VKNTPLFSRLFWIKMAKTGKNAKNSKKLQNWHILIKNAEIDEKH